MHVIGSGGNIVRGTTVCMKMVGDQNTGNVWSEVCVCDECHNEGREEGDERGVGVKLAEKKHNIIQDNAR